MSARGRKPLLATLASRWGIPTAHVQSRDKSRSLCSGSIIRESGPTLDTGRNLLVQDFLSTGVEWLLKADSDMTFAPEDVERLLSYGSPPTRSVLGGLCFAYGDEVYPTLIQADEKGDPGPIMYDYPEDQLVKVDFTGAAFLLIHRQVLLDIQKKVGNKWFSYTTKYGSAEDLAFCARVHDVGYDIYVHTGIEPGHLRVKPVTRSDYRKPQSELGKQMRLF